MFSLEQFQVGPCTRFIMGDEVEPFKKDAPLASLMADAEEDTEGIKELAGLVGGCRNDVEGIQTKKHIVQKHVTMRGGDCDLLQVLCALHAKEVLQIPPADLFGVLKFRAAVGAKKGGGPHNPGHFLATALAACDNKENMRGVVGAYIASNPKLDQVALFAYINDKGFVEYDGKEVIDVIDWTPPDSDGGRPAAWKVLWAMRTSAVGHTPARRAPSLGLAWSSR